MVERRFGRRKQFRDLAIRYATGTAYYRAKPLIAVTASAWSQI